jgi:4-amino-4-deoxy-L-arabinose transferase-like glycosyltransferase
VPPGSPPDREVASFSMASEDSARRSGRPFAEGIVLAAVGAAMAFLTWRRWPDILVDFGQQLYIPWRLSQGERLGRDIFYLHGPLSQHWHAILFSLFGVSFSTLIGANLLVVATLTIVLHRITLRLADRSAAFLAALAFLTLFAFAQYVQVGNYNFMAPYTHEAAHGTLLACAMVLFLLRWLEEGRRRDAGVAGLLLGLTLMTKAEVALSALAATLAAVAAASLRPPAARPSRTRPWLGALVLLAGGAVLPGALFFLFFSTYLDAGRAFGAAAAGFVSLGGDLTRFALYRHALGIDDPAGNLLAAVVAGVWGTGFLAAAWGIERLATRRAEAARAAPLVAGLVVFVVLVVADGVIPWMELPRLLPFAAAAAALVATVKLLRGCRRAAGFLVMAVFALAMTGKAALNLHLFHYGFFLALPATVLVIAALVHHAPRLLATRRGGGAVFRAVAVAAVAACCLHHVRWTREIDGLKTLPLGDGGDRIITFGPEWSDQGPPMKEALDWIRRSTPPDSSLVGLPEGIMLDYLARRVTTVPLVNFTTGEVIVWGETTLLEALSRRPPDYVALVARRTEDLGLGRFGAVPGYGRRVVQWVEARYETVARFGAEPLAGEGFGVRILRRRDAARGETPIP